MIEIVSFLMLMVTSVLGIGFAPSAEKQGASNVTPRATLLAQSGPEKSKMAYRSCVSEKAASNAWARSQVEAAALIAVTDCWRQEDAYRAEAVNLQVSAGVSDAAANDAWERKLGPDARLDAWQIALVSIKEARKTATRR